MQSDFHITIGSSSDDGSFSNELRLIKASLLYADKITLCCPIASEAIRYLSIIESDFAKQMAFMEAYAKENVNKPTFDREALKGFLESLEFYKFLNKRKHPTPKEIQAKMRLKDLVSKSFMEMKDVWFEAMQTFGMTSIIPLIESKILDVKLLNDSVKADIPRALENMVTFLEEAISNQKTYPLFDDQIGNLVKLGIQENKINISESGVSRSRHSSLAINFLERLPSFDEAEVSEILDIRTELAKPLIRFRSAIIKFSSEIKNASWDAEFEYDAENVFRREVEPAILDIEEAIKSNKYLANLARKLLGNSLVIPSGSALGIMVSPLADLPYYVTAALGAGLSSGILAYDAYKEWDQNKKRIEQNGLFFYYKAKKKLSD